MTFSDENILSADTELPDEKKSPEPENAPRLARFGQNSTSQNSQKLARISLLILPQNRSFLPEAEHSGLWLVEVSPEQVELEEGWII